MRKEAERPVIVLGGGGHAKVLMQILLSTGRHVLGFTDRDVEKPDILGIKRLGDDEYVRANYNPKEVSLVNGIGSVSSTTSRQQLYEYFSKKGYFFESVIHPSAIIDSSAVLSDGIQVMAGAVLQPGVRTGVNCVVNTRSSIDHDCEIGSHAHVAPGATLSGCVRVGEGAHVGVGATVIQGITIGAHSVVGAGAVVIDDVPDCVTVVGVPARSISGNKTEDSK